VPVYTGGVLAGRTLTQIATGSGTTCALGSTGAAAAYCWGANGSGQLGDGTTTQRTAPFQVLMLSPLPPAGVTAAAADTTAAIPWTAPATLDSGTFTGYAATAEPGGASCSATTTSCTITGLTGGTTYSVTVVTRTTDGNSDRRHRARRSHRRRLHRHHHPLRVLTSGPGHGRLGRRGRSR
jgi:hypothetical protein